MTTESTTPTTPTAPAAPKAKTFTIRLTAGVEEVLIVAYPTKTGYKSSATRYREAAVKGKKRSGERGASQEYANAVAAKAGIEKLAAAFVKQGWVRPEKKAFGGFVAKPDAFSASNLPKAPKK